MPDDFFNLRRSGTVHVIELTLAGSLESAEFDRLNQQLLATLDGFPGGSWVIDVSATKYVGSSVLGVFVNVRQHLKANRGRLVLCGLSPRLYEVFEACSLQRLFTLRDNAVAAVAALMLP